jgi:hypothetical protein
VIKSRIMGWAGNVECMGYWRDVYRFWWVNVRERGHWRDTGVDGKIILSWIFRKGAVVVWTVSSWLRIGTCGGHLLT